MVSQYARSIFSALTLSCILAACGGEDPIAPPVPTTLAAAFTTSASGTAGSAATPLPTVIVRDQRGDQMAGVQVAFSVTGGGGNITGAVQTTDASGVAALGGWTLGTTAGANMVTATSGSLNPVMFTATGNAGPPSSATKSAGDGGNAVAGAIVMPAPAVQVRDANGNTVPGVTVTFAVTDGGGSVSGGTQTTDNAGVATVGGWTLGTTAGPNTLSASVNGVQTLTFTATGRAGPPAVVTKSSGDDGSATVDTSLPISPKVIVKDVNGNVVSGANVNFVIAGGGGTVSGATQTTNALGEASVGGWTLGRTAGTNTLTATVPTLPAVTFTATGTPGPLASVNVEPVSFGILIGDTVTLRAVPRDAYGNVITGLTTSWEPAEPTASISPQGFLTALNDGHAVLRASVGGMTNNQGGAGVSVYGRVDSTSFVHTPIGGPAQGWTEPSLQIGATVCARLFTFGSAGITNALRWTPAVSDPSIVSVILRDDQPQSHCFRGLRSGTVTVSGSFGGATASKTLTVP